MTTPLLAPPEAQPSAGTRPDVRTDELARPYRLGLVGVGVAVGLFSRLLAVNGIGELNSQPMAMAAALTSLIVGIGLLMIAAERDRFGPSLGWIAAVTALSWGTLNWISPPFDDSVTEWSNEYQLVLALLGAGNGLLFAGLVSLAFVRRSPTMTVAATMVAAVVVLAANTIALRAEWPAIISLGVAFGLVLLAWDRTPRREKHFRPPDSPPRTSRAALSLASVALGGTTLQLWISRSSIPRATGAVAVAAVLILAAFASLVRVRREIERRETTLSEWKAWMREVRTNHFRAEMENFESSPAPRPMSAARPASQPAFPNLLVPDKPTPKDLIAGIGAADRAAAAASVPATISPPIERPSDVAGILPPTGDPRLPRADVAPSKTARPAGAYPLADILPPPSAPPQIASGSDPEPITTPEPVAAQAPPSEPEPIPQPVAAQAPPSEPEPIPQPVAGQAPPSGPAPEIALGSDPDAIIAGPFTTQVTPAEVEKPGPRPLATLDEVGAWLSAPEARTRVQPLLVAVEAMSLARFEKLSLDDAALVLESTADLLGETIPGSECTAWVDGPYFIVAIETMSNADLLELNRAVLTRLRSTVELSAGTTPINGTLAMLRPAPSSTVDQVVSEAVKGLLEARRVEAAMLGNAANA